MSTPAASASEPRKVIIQPHSGLTSERMERLKALLEKGKTGAQGFGIGEWEEVQTLCDVSTSHSET